VWWALAGCGARCDERASSAAPAARAVVLVVTRVLARPSGRREHHARVEGDRVRVPERREQHDGQRNPTLHQRGEFTKNRRARAWPNGTYTSKESYRLEITTQHDIAEFSRVVGFPQKTQADRLASIVPAVGSFAGNRAINRDTAVVNRVEDLGEVDDVYDFRAPTTSSGLANGVIVHNCGEYLFIDDSACNLASINLLWFLLPNNTFDVDAFHHILAHHCRLGTRRALRP
jgi:ribonucleotide reductase alpha subunit